VPIQQLTFPFDGVEYGAERFAMAMGHIVSNGVVPGYLQQLRPYADSTGMRVKLEPGALWIGTTGATALARRRWYEYTKASGDADMEFPIAANTSGVTRFDRLVATLDVNNTASPIRLRIKQGDASTGALAALVRGSTVYEVGLAQIRVANNAVTIAAADVTDERNNPVVCGWAFPQAASPADNTDYQRDIVPILDSSRTLHSRFAPMGEDVRYSGSTTATTSTRITPMFRAFFGAVQRTLTLRCYVEARVTAGQAGIRLVYEGQQLDDQVFSNTATGIFVLAGTAQVTPGARGRAWVETRTNNSANTVYIAHDAIVQEV
jgi:hypothetical protein